MSDNISEARSGLKGRSGADVRELVQRLTALVPNKDDLIQQLATENLFLATEKIRLTAEVARFSGQSAKVSKAEKPEEAAE